jgi:hypothetical protein
VFLNPLIYAHLINIAEIFLRPLAKSGDVQKLKENENQHILKHATKVCFVKKKGTTLRFWYEYIAVFSGSQIYFYSKDKKMVIQEVLTILQN